MQDYIDLNISSLYNMVLSFLSSPSIPCPHSFAGITGQVFFYLHSDWTSSAQWTSASLPLEGTRHCQSLPLLCFSLRNHHNMSQGEQARLYGVATPVSLSNRVYKNPSQCFSNLPLPACEISLLRHSQQVKSLESSPIPGRRPLDDWIAALKPDFVCSASKRSPCHFLFKQRRGSYPFSAWG